MNKRKWKSMPGKENIENSSKGNMPMDDSLVLRKDNGDLGMKTARQGRKLRHIRDLDLSIIHNRN